MKRAIALTIAAPFVLVFALAWWFTLALSWVIDNATQEKP